MRSPTRAVLLLPHLVSPALIEILLCLLSFSPPFYLVTAPANSLCPLLSNLLHYLCSSFVVSLFFFPPKCPPRPPLIMGCDTLSHGVISQLIRRRTSSIPAGQRDLKTAKSVLLPPAGQPTCQSCGVAGPLQREGWLGRALQHREESSSLKYLGSRFRPRLGPLARAVQRFDGWHRGRLLFAPLPASHISHPTILAAPLCSSPSLFLFPASIILFLVISSRGRCRAGLAVSSEQLARCSGSISAAADKHRSVRRAPARVLRGLAGPGRVERKDRRGLGRLFPPGGEQLLPRCHLLSGTGAQVPLPVGRGSDGMSKRGMCARSGRCPLLGVLIRVLWFSLITGSWMGLFSLHGYLTENLFSGQRGTFFPRGTTFQGSRTNCASHHKRSPLPNNPTM